MFRFQQYSYFPVVSPQLYGHALEVDNNKESDFRRLGISLGTGPNFYLVQGWAGMTFGRLGTGTGMDNSIPEIWNGKGMEKTHSQNSGMGGEWTKTFPKFGNWKEMKKIYSHILGTGIKGYHFREYPETGMKKTNKIWQYKKTFKKYVAQEGVLAQTLTIP